MAKLFGFSIEDTQTQSPTVVSPVAPNNEDGVDHYLTSGFFGSYGNKVFHQYTNSYKFREIFYQNLKVQEGIQELRYIDAMKMRYVRQQKKKPNDNSNYAKSNVDNPMDYDFPEIEEYFIYNPKSSYPVVINFI